MLDSWWPHGLQHTRLLCPPLSPRICSNSSLLSWWYLYNHFLLCHPLLLLPSVFPSIRVLSSELSLRIRWLKYWSFRFSILPMKDWFPLGWAGLTSLQSQGSLESSPAQFKNINSLVLSPLYGPTLTTLMRVSWHILAYIYSVHFDEFCHTCVLVKPLAQPR